MFQAIKNNNYQIVKELLLDNGITNNQKNNYLYNACKDGNYEIVELLLMNGANPNAKTLIGNTPLNGIFQNGIRLLDIHLKIIQLLLNYNADINLANKYGGTPLHYLLVNQRNCLPFVKILLENGADVNAKAKRGDTPLLSACMFHEYPTVKMLVDNGSDMQLIFHNVKYFIHYPCLRDDHETLKLILEHDNDINNKINFCFAYQISKYDGAYKCLKVIRNHIIWSCWKFYNDEYNIYMEWLPKELIEDLIELI